MSGQITRAFPEMSATGCRSLIWWKTNGVLYNFTRILYFTIYTDKSWFAFCEILWSDQTNHWLVHLESSAFARLTLAWPFSSAVCWMDVQAKSVRSLKTYHEYPWVMVDHGPFEDFLFLYTYLNFHVSTWMVLLLASSKRWISGMRSLGHPCTLSVGDGALNLLSWRWESALFWSISWCWVVLCGSCLRGFEPALLGILVIHKLGVACVAELFSVCSKARTPNSGKLHESSSRGWLHGTPSQYTRLVLEHFLPGKDAKTYTKVLSV